MKAKISPRDIELLSAFLDKELGSTQRARLEARLRTESELRSGLDDLRRTRTLLRSLPSLKAPRNFTLTPQMVDRRHSRETSPRHFYPIFQFASALAGFLLVVVLLGDFLGLGISPQSTQNEPAMVMMEPMETAEFEAKIADTQSSTEPSWGAQELQMQEAPVEATDEQDETLAMPAPAPTPAITTTPLSQTISGEPLITLPASDETERGSEIVASKGWQGQPDRSLWRVVEISLAVAFLAFGMTAIYLRRFRGPVR